MCTCCSMCTYIIVTLTVMIKSELNFNKSHLGAAFKRKWISSQGFLCFFPLAWKTLLSISFNWKVMKFIFKGMTWVYEDYLRAEMGQAYLGLILREGSVCTNSECLVLSQCHYEITCFFISALPSGSYYRSNWWTKLKLFQLSPKEGLVLPETISCLRPRCRCYRWLNLVFWFCDTLRLLQSKTS